MWLNFKSGHLKFEELYNDLLLKTDEVAERIITLGFAPKHKYSKYAQVDGIKESTKVVDGIKSVE